MEHYDITTYVAYDSRNHSSSPTNNVPTDKHQLLALEHLMKDHRDVNQRYTEFITEFVEKGHVERTLQVCVLNYPITEFSGNVRRPSSVLYYMAAASPQMVPP